MLDGKKNPTPYGGFTKLNFLLKDFTKLTALLNRYLRADADALKDRVFFEKSTTMMFYLVANALSAVGNYDESGKLSASKIPDGSISMEIVGGACAELAVRDGHMATYNRKAEKPRAYMIFADLDTARGLFDGSVEAMGALASGKIIMKGYIPMIENLNRVLGRVGVYLA
jgi:putative sterol carrier protein